MKKTSRKVFTLDQLAEHLQVHPDTIRRAVARGEIAVARVGALWRFPLKEVERITNAKIAKARPHKKAKRRKRK